MLAAACAVGVGCCFAAPIGGRVPPAHTSHPCSRVLVERPAGPCPERPSLLGWDRDLPLGGQLAWERQCR